MRECSAKIAMAVRVTGCQSDDLATCGDRRLEIALGEASIAEIGEVVRIASETPPAAPFLFGLGARRYPRRWPRGVDLRICQIFAASLAEPGNSHAGLVLKQPATRSRTLPRVHAMAPPEAAPPNGMRAVSRNQKTVRRETAADAIIRNAGAISSPVRLISHVATSGDRPPKTPRHRL
jgi:hypothetical protein